MSTGTHIQLKVDNGPESSGTRAQFLKRMVAFADDTGKVIQLLSSIAGPQARYNGCDLYMIYETATGKPN